MSLPRSFLRIQYSIRQYLKKMFFQYMVERTCMSSISVKRHYRTWLHIIVWTDLLVNMTLINNVVKQNRCLSWLSTHWILWQLLPLQLHSGRVEDNSIMLLPCFSLFIQYHELTIIQWYSIIQHVFLQWSWFT
jgi:hypothetical protein